MGYRRFVALGDSCTEGLDDHHPENGLFRGWADFVAGRMSLLEPDFRYANLGVRGRRLDQITAEQMPTAAELKPDLIALFGGGNDVMSSGWDARTVARRVDAAISQATSIAPDVVVFTLSDIAERMPFGRRMRPRIEALNDAIREAAVSYGARLVDLWPDEAVSDSRYFGPDRLHLSELGHLRLAAHLLAKLGLPYEQSWLDPLPGTPSRPTWREDVHWFRHQVLPVAITRTRNRMIGRSPGDGFLPKRPQLLPVEGTPAWIPGNA
ncbi:SGNH/GDSL hydrolase family protein [Amycolatopsis sp. cg5]|uniref:SGNH/GDSL hydrolase family protein n=1 Tax=Amycolatopsis sp. cg5 TaxID=3238802 RepID=UPI0035232F7E